MSVTRDDVLRITRQMEATGRIRVDARERRNQENWSAYKGEQSFEHKADFQSQETTPTFPMAVEQIVGTFERALTDTDDWVTAERVGLGGDSVIEPVAARKLLMFYLERLYTPGATPDTLYGIQQYVGDSVKRGILEPQIIAKVYPMKRKETRFRMKTVDIEGDADAPLHTLAKKQVLSEEEIELTRIAIDLIPYHDFYEDPSPLNRWRMHRSQVSLSELKANPEYDQAAVERLFAVSENDESERRRREKAGETQVPSGKSTVTLWECWGDLIDEMTGEVLEHNVWWAVSGAEVLRQPSPNPNADGTDPFVVSAILRVPGAKVGKALADHAVPMWRLANEIVNLNADQALRAAWGVGQVRTDIMEAPEEVANGVPQGYTAVLKPNAPLGVKFYERVDNGEASPISLEMMNRINQEVQTALAVPDSRLGQLPQRAVKATELVQALQSSGSLYEAFAARYEDTHLEPIFEKAWKRIIQYVDDFMEEELVQAIGPRLTLQISDLSDSDRWSLLQAMRFKIRGLRGVANRERRFNKVATILNMLQQNPQLLQFFMQTKDMNKLFADLMAASGVDPERWDRDDLEQPDATLAQAQNQLAEALVAEAGGQAGASAPGIQNTIPEQRGNESAFAPNNPAAGGIPGVV